MRLSSFAGTDVGRARSGNEDSYFCGRTVFAVADGLGGHQGGEVASAAAVEPLAALDGHELAGPGEAAEALTAAIRDGNAAILDRAAGDPGLWGMGTTVTAAAWRRAPPPARPRRRQPRLPPPRRLVRPGHHRPHRSSASSSAAAASPPPRPPSTPNASILTRAVGLDPRIPVDTPDPIDLRPGDQVLLCSDGLTEAVPDLQIAELLTANPDGHAACRALIDTANNAGGPDNITLIIIRVE
jgi:protein phosphatase